MGGAGRRRKGRRMGRMDKKKEGKENKKEENILFQRLCTILVANRTGLKGEKKG